MSLDKEKTAPVENKKKAGTEKVKQVAKQDISDLLNDEFLEKQKAKYGETQASFITGVRNDEDYKSKCKGMSDGEVWRFAKEEPGLKQYYEKFLKKNKDAPSSTESKNKDTEKKAPSKNKESYENYDAEWWLRDNEHWEAFKQSEYDRLRKEKWEAAAFAYKDKRRNASKPGTANPEEKKPEIKPEAPKEEKKIETPKEEIKKEEKIETPKPEEKKPEVKKEKKKHFRSNRFKKKEKTEKKPEAKKEKKPGIGKTIGNGIKAIPHQTRNAISYAPRVAWKTAVYGLFGRYDNGLGKPELKKNRDKYASSWKWEQTAKKK